MKLDMVTEEAEVLKSEDFESLEYGIAEGQGALLFKILSQYSNPIGSLVRETVTNAFDSHIEAGIDDDITVRINEGNKLTGISRSFEVEDYGVGLSPERVREIYSKFLASTKRGGNAEHGAFGLGSKSPLSYCDMFYVITRYEGTEYVYTIHKGIKAPQIDKMDAHPTDKGNGTVVSVPIKGGDKTKFINEIKRQLPYFDSIKYVNCGINNDYKIYRGKHFLYREGSTAENVHMALGKVYYPIDWNAIQNHGGYDSKYRSFYNKAPIALRFEIGDLPVVWNRENIEYTDQAIKTIKKKLDDVRKELQTLYDKHNSDIQSLDKYIEAVADAKKNKGGEIAEGVSIPNLNDLVDLDVKYPKYHDHLDKIPKNPFFDFTSHRLVKEGLVAAHQGLPNILDLYRNDEDIFYCKGSYETKKNKYLYHKKDYEKFFIIRKNSDSDLHETKGLAGVFGTTSVEITPKQEQLIEDFREEAEQLVEDMSIDYDSIQVPDSFDQWLKDNDTGGSSSVGKNYNPDEEIPYKPIYRDTDSYHFDKLERLKFSRDHIKIDDLVNSNALIIYGHREDAEKLQEVAGIFFSRKEFFTDTWNTWDLKEERIAIFKISQSNEKYIKDKLNAYHVDDYINSDHRTLIKFITARCIEKKLPYEIKNFNQFDALGKVCPRMDYLLSEVNRYRRRYYDQSVFSLNTDASNALEKLLEREDLLDERILDKYEELIAFYNKYPLITEVDLQGEDNREEFRVYMEAKGYVHPLLLERFKNYKQQKQDNNGQ